MRCLLVIDMKLLKCKDFITRFQIKKKNERKKERKKHQNERNIVSS